MSVRELRGKLVERGITQREFAEAAHMPPSAFSAMLNGREYLGPRREARIADAIVRLGLDQEAPPPAERPEPVIRIRQP